jgi:hypothetical protein
MDAFKLAVQGWHDYYHIIGDASAALTGLLFVSLSLNVHEITRKANADLRLLAGQTFSSFICLVMFSLLFVIPDQGPRGLGLPMLGIDLILLIVATRRFLQTRRRRPRTWGRGNLLLRFVIPPICSIAILVIAVTVLLGKTGGLYWFVPVTILLLWDASINAWDLLLKLHEPQKE